MLKRFIRKYWMIGLQLLHLVDQKTKIMQGWFFIVPLKTQNVLVFPGKNIASKYNLTYDRSSPRTTTELVGYIV
jgi:hypothetical protein